MPRAHHVSHRLFDMVDSYAARLPVHAASPVFAVAPAQRNPHTLNLLGTYATSTPVTAATCLTFRPRRGRRTDIPPEQREQTRRMKKQNLERRRRACITDKLNALHTLAMKLIGLDPNERQKAEKADILTTCYKVLEGIAEVAREKPDLQSRLNQLRSQIPELAIVPTSSQDEANQSSTYFANEENDSLFGISPATNSGDGENRPPIARFVVRRSIRSPAFPGSDDYLLHSVANPPNECDTFTSCSLSDSGVYSPQCGVSDLTEVTPTDLRHPHISGQHFRSRRSGAAQTGSLVAAVHPPPRFQTPLPSPSWKHPMRSMENLPIPSSSTAFKRINTKDSSGASSVWRPYL
ncbi:unnamed protein product [Dicrocoelium dendriticum]|nr:unnamed protein product [Dicrocoelium dendriticum]